MERAQFWRLIEDAKARSGGECEAQVKLIQEALVLLPPEEIIAFDEIYDVFRFESYRWNLRGAATLIIGGSADGFEYFRGWLIAQGNAVYHAALKDPDSLVDVLPDGFDDAECEDMLYVAGQAYEEKMGNKMPSRKYVYPEIIGQKWQDDSQLDAMFPRLSAIAGPEVYEE